MASLLLPYLQKCLSSVFPPTELSSVMGLSLVDLRQQGVGHIRIDKVLEPVRQFIPVAIDTAAMATVGDTTVYVADRMKELASAADDNDNDGDNDHGNDEVSGKKAQEEETENSKWVVGGDDEGEKADVERPEIHGDSENETSGVETTSHDNVIEDIIGNALTLASASEQNNIVDGLDDAK